MLVLINVIIDDVTAKHAEFAEIAIDPSPIEYGSIHNTNPLSGPKGYELTVTFLR